MDFELAKQQTNVKLKLDEFSVCELRLASPVALIENSIQNFFIYADHIRCNFLLITVNENVSFCSPISLRIRMHT
jgi:hypothetical protein